MAVDFGNFAGSFLQALTASRRNAQEQSDAKVERDAKLKLFELQLKREQQQSDLLTQQTAARQQLSDLLSGGGANAPATPPNGLPDSQGPVAPAAGPAATPSLTELLADPKNALLFLKSGMGDLKDVATLQNQGQMRQILQHITGGAPGAGPGQPTVPGGMGITGIKFDSSGNPMFDIGPAQVKTWQVSPDGKTKIGYDEQGRPIATIPASPADRAPEDKPLTPEELSKFRLPDGKMLAPGTTLRQATALGAIPSSPPGESDKSKSLLVQNMQDAEKTLASLPPGADSGSITDTALGSNPVTALATSEAYRKYQAAALRWAQNYVFLKSGATAGPAEIQQTLAQFFPRPNDPDEVKAQKLQARLNESTVAAQTYNVGGQKNATAGALPEGIPAGSTLIGTAGGKPVYQAPDGKRYRVK